METTPQIKDGINLTAAAAAEVNRLLSLENNAEKRQLRISVKGGGCAGFSYEMTFDAAKETDLKFESHGIIILTDMLSELHLKGLEIDFGTGLSARGFIYNNPNATKVCGCGESFG